MKINTIVFDLDGTLLDTIDDLADAVNYALRTNGLPERSRAEVRSFLGNGIRVLMSKSSGFSEEEAESRISREKFEEAFQCFKEYYVDHCLIKTQPYPGIMSLLDRLKAEGFKMAIVSNKLHAAVKQLADRFFSGYVASAVGESPTVRRKPCPDAVLTALSELGSTREESVYVGDSEVDIETSRAAGIPGISVLWGFRDRDVLERQYPEAHFIERPDQLPDAIAAL